MKFVNSRSKFHSGSCGGIYFDKSLGVEFSMRNPVCGIFLPWTAVGVLLPVDVNEGDKGISPFPEA